MHCAIRSAADPGDVEGECPMKKKIPAMVMWYAPIIPRLKHLLPRRCDGIEKTVRKTESSEYPLTGRSGEKSKKKYGKEFADDARSVWFGLSADGIDPFGEQSSNHSTWPVTLCLYNLLLWLCMKRSSL